MILSGRRRTISAKKMRGRSSGFVVDFFFIFPTRKVAYCLLLVLPGLAWDSVRALLGQERKFSTTEQDTNSVIVEAAEATRRGAGLGFWS